MIKQIKDLAKTLPLLALAGSIALTGCDNSSGSDESAEPFAAIEAVDADENGYSTQATAYIGGFTDRCLVFTFERHPDVKIDLDFQLVDSDGINFATKPVDLVNNDRAQVTYNAADFAINPDYVDIYAQIRYVEGDTSTGGGYNLRWDHRPCW